MTDARLSADSTSERTGHCPLCWTYSKSDDYCSSFEEAIASTAERPMGCPWFTSEDRANWRARHKSSDGEPSNGKQPLMASRPAPPVPSDQTFHVAQPYAMKAIADDCRSAAETWRKDMPHYATRDPDSIAAMYERIAESIDRALAAQPPAAPVETTPLALADMLRTADALIGIQEDLPDAQDRDALGRDGSEAHTGDVAQPTPDKVREALAEAYLELKKHAADYHHRTPDDVNNRIVDALAPQPPAPAQSSQVSRDALAVAAYLEDLTLPERLIDLLLDRKDRSIIIAALKNYAAQPPAAPVETERKTFPIPPWHEAVRDSEGRATGEVRPRLSAGTDYADKWPPLKMALWTVLMDEKLNDGHYIKAFDLIEKLYSAALNAGGTPEPVIWVWRACVGGVWGSWRELDQPIERFKEGPWGFNLKNGTAEVQALYRAVPQEAPEPLRHAFRAADDIDWAHLDQFIPHSGHGQFWRAVFKEVRAALALSRPQHSTGETK